MKFELEPYNRGITKAEVVADISSVARHLGNNTLTADESESTANIVPTWRDGDADHGYKL